MKLPLIGSKSAGKRTYMDFSGDDVTVVTEQKVDHILEHNKRQANDWRPGGMIGDTQRHHQKVAEIPETLYYELVRRLGPPKHNLGAWKKWLNDIDNRHFRSTGGTV